MSDSMNAFISGGYTPVRKVTVRDYEVFRRAMLLGPVGINYTPATVMSKRVSGTTKYIFGAHEDIATEFGTRHSLAAVTIFER